MPDHRKGRAILLGKIGHECRVDDALLIDPLEDLLGPELWHGPVHAPAGE